MITTPLCFKIFVRYARKPLWMPTAPSKLFRISEHNFYKPEEIAQIKLLYEAYRAQEDSIKELMRHEFYIPATLSGGLPKEFVELEQEQDQAKLEENNQRNAEVAREREQYMNSWIEGLEDKLLEEKFKREEELLDIGLKIDRFIDEQKSIEDCFVTPENFDRMIEKALANPVNFEHYIDVSGRIYQPKPEVKLN